MAYSANHLLFRIIGHFGPTVPEKNDEWSVGFRIFLGGVALVEGNKSAFLAAVQPQVTSFHQNTATNAGTMAWVDKLTAAYIGQDGKYVGGDAQPTTELIYGTPIAGSGANGMPYSHARCYTLQSTIDRGPGHTGRFYYPTQTVVDTSGRWSTTLVANALTPAVALINAINTAARAQWSPASSVAVFSKVGTGTIGIVTRVSVGRAPDTQRRRDNKLLEDHLFSAVATTQDVAADVLDRQYD